MPPVVPLLGSIAASSFGGLFLTATATGGFALTAFGQLAAGVALSAISRALMPKPETGGSGGQKIKLTFGEDQPQSFIMGTYATSGDLVYHGSWGKIGDTPNIYYVQVIELSDLPARFKRLWLNGEWVTVINDVDTSYGMGRPIQQYRHNGKDFLYFKYHDGTQTAADQYLIDQFGDDETKPWSSAMIGRGIPYAIITARFKPELLPERPECVFELEAWGHYDRRKDSTAGGVGTHRADNWLTWEPSDNPIVLVDNILRGIKDPITNEVIFGGPAIQSQRLSASMEFAAMNACDGLVPVGNTGTTEKRYRAGLEVRVSEEPASIIEELLKTCVGEISVACGQWLMRAGGPGLPVYHFTDNDIETMTNTDRFEPFPALDGAYNEATAVYPDPLQGYATKEAPPRKNATYLAEDRGLRNVAELKFPACPFRHQVQRLMFSALADQRRFRRHTVVLFPEASRLAPLDEVSWTSTRYGYVNKVFAIDLVEHLASGCVAVSLRERDPTDYDWDGSQELDDPVGFPLPPGRPPQVASFEVFGAIIYDDNGVERRPAIRLVTPVMDNVTGIRYRVYNASMSQINANAVINQVDEGAASLGVMELDDVPASLDNVLAEYGLITDLDGEAYIVGNGIISDTDFLVQILFEPVTTNRVWSELKPVHTPFVGLTRDDFSDLVNQVIDDARDDAQAAREDVLDMQGRVTIVEETVAGITGPVLAELHEVADALALLDIGTLTELLGVAAAGAINGWAPDPRFLAWTVASLDHWTMTGTASLSKTTLGIYPSALLINAASGSSPGLVQVSASSIDVDELLDADFTAPYVVVGLRMKYLSGNMAGLQCRPEWRQTGTGIWFRGRAFGEDASLGSITSRWGWIADTGYTQDHSFIFEKPAISTNAIRIMFLKDSTDLNAVSVRLEVFDIRSATDPELDAYNAHGDAAVQISALNLAITGPTGAIFASQNQMRLEFGDADGLISDSLILLGNDVESLTGRISVTQSQFGGNNFVKNPVFDDGPRPAGAIAENPPTVPIGSTPQWWSQWNAGFSVVERGGVTAPLSTAPTRYVAQSIGTGATLREARAHDLVPVVPGQRVLASLRAAGVGTAINVNISMRIRFVQADRVTTAGTPLDQTINLTSTNWVTSAFTPLTVQPGAAYMETYVRRLAGGSANSIMFTNVSVVMADDVALARAEEAIVASTTATGAVTGFTTTINAQFGSVESFVTQSAFAVASANFAASTYTFRVTAGGGDASIRLVAFDDVAGSGSAILLTADNIIAPGTMSVGRLVVMDHGTNLVPDDQIQSSNDWTRPASMTVIPATTTTLPDSRGELRWNFSAGNALLLPAVALSQLFPVRVSARLVCSFQVLRLTGVGTRVRAEARIYWYDRNSIALPLVPFTSIAIHDSVATTIASYQQQLIVPAGAKLARFGFVALGDGTDASIRFFSPKVIVNEDASVLITPDGAFFERLTAEEAWIGSANIRELTVGTIHIMDGAVSSTAWTSVGTRASNVSGDWEGICSLAITRRPNTTLFVMAGAAWLNAGSPSDRVRMRLLRVGVSTTVLQAFGEERPARDSGHTTRSWVDSLSLTGPYTYQIQIFVPASYPAAFEYEDITLYLQELAK